MNGADLFEGLSFVDERLIAEAEEKKLKKPMMRLMLPIAASFAAVIMAASMWSIYQNGLPFGAGNNPQTSNNGSAPLKNTYTLHYNKVDGQLARSIHIEGHFWEELTTLQSEKILPNIAEKYRIGGRTSYSHVAGITSIFSIDMNVHTSNEDVKITIAPNEVAKCYIIDGKPVLSEIEGVEIEAGVFITDKNSKGEQNHIYYADFKIDDIAYYVEYTGDNSDKEFFANIIADIILGGKADLSELDSPTVPKLRDDTLTESQAYAETDFGAYLLKVPSNYLLNSATRFTNQDSDYLSASWSHGYDDIDIAISRVREEDNARIISPQDKELYDMSLYAIPWAESMPADTREIIENPIFKIEDLTPSILKMREYVRGEQGDPSGNSVNMIFCVLYDDIIVEVSAEGVSSEYLFDELSQLGKNGQ